MQPITGEGLQIKRLGWFCLLTLVGCASDPTNHTYTTSDSTDFTLCFFAVCSQNHVVGEGEDNSQTDSPETDVDVSPI